MSDQVIALIEEAVRDGAESLSLSGQDLAELPEALRDLADTLVDLDLSYNRIDRLPPWLAELSRLRFLDLAHNQLVDLPDALVAIGSLTRLDLTDNLLVKIPAALGAMPCLETLHVAGNRHLVQPPPGVAAQGPAALLNYLREIAKPDTASPAPAPAPAPLQHPGGDPTAKAVSNAAAEAVAVPTPEPDTTSAAEPNPTPTAEASSTRTRRTAVIGSLSAVAVVAVVGPCCVPSPPTFLTGSPAAWSPPGGRRRAGARSARRPR